MRTTPARGGFDRRKFIKSMSFASASKEVCVALRWSNKRETGMTSILLFWIKHYKVYVFTRTIVAAANNRDVIGSELAFCCACCCRCCVVAGLRVDVVAGLRVDVVAGLRVDVEAVVRVDVVAVVRVDVDAVRTSRAAAAAVPALSSLSLRWTFALHCVQSRETKKVQQVI